MTRPFKLKLILLATLLAIAALAWFSLSRVDVKSEFEAAATQATGLDVSVAGNVAVRILPTLHVAMQNVSMRNGRETVATIGETDVGLQFWPLLHRQVRIRRLEMHDVKFSLVRDEHGLLNVARSTPGDGTVPAAALHRLILTRASIAYDNRRTGKRFEANDCSLDTSDLQLTAGAVEDVMKHLGLTARLACKEMRQDKFVGTDVVTAVNAADGIFKFRPLTLKMMGGDGNGSLEANFTQDTPVLRLHYTLSQLQVAELFATISPTQSGEGALDFSTELSMRGTDGDSLSRTLQGKASLNGKNLKIAGGNLDEKLDRYESSQNFNLIDVGAFFIAGPLGPALTKGYNFANVLQNTRGDTQIVAFASQWNIDHGIAQAQDVALATRENRLALKGGLNFVEDRFDDVTVALIDDKGCVRVLQKIHGPFRQPVIDKPNVLVSLAGPVTRLVHKVKDIAGGKCDVFYDGSVIPVTQPEKQ